MVTKINEQGAIVHDEEASEFVKAWRTGRDPGVELKIAKSGSALIVEVPSADKDKAR